MDDVNFEELFQKMLLLMQNLKCKMGYKVIGFQATDVEDLMFCSNYFPQRDKVREGSFYSTLDFVQKIIIDARDESRLGPERENFRQRISEMFSSFKNDFTEKITEVETSFFSSYPLLNVFPSYRFAMRLWNNELETEETLRSATRDLCRMMVVKNTGDQYQDISFNKVKEIIDTGFKDLNEKIWDINRKLMKKNECCYFYKQTYLKDFFETTELIKKVEGNKGYNIIEVDGKHIMQAHCNKTMKLRSQEESLAELQRWLESNDFRAKRVCGSVLRMEEWEMNADEKALQKFVKKKGVEQIAKTMSLMGINEVDFNGKSDYFADALVKICSKIKVLQTVRLQLKWMNVDVILPGILRMLLQSPKISCLEIDTEGGQFESRHMIELMAALKQNTSLTTLSLKIM